MTTTTSIEHLITSNPEIGTHPKLEALTTEYLAALAGGYEPEPALLTEMFAVLVDITTTDPDLNILLDALTTEIVEQVILRDENLAAELSSMLSYYAEQIESGYEPDEATTTAILGSLETVVTSDPALQAMLDAVSEMLALPTTFGVTFFGIDPSAFSGYAVSSAGDVNGDGLDDILIGAPGATSFAGETYVVFGRSEGFDPTLDLTTLTDTDGFAFTGIHAGGHSGWSVSSAGDVNGDGVDDILIGAHKVNTDTAIDAGEIYVVFGQSGGFDPTLDLASLDATTGFTITGINAGDFSGYSVSSAGDLNGDNLDDILIGAPEANGHAGEIYVVFGQSRGFDPTLDLASLDATTGFSLAGINTGDYSGISVSSAGDWNGDGLDDILFGAWGADSNGYDAGESYVVFGQRDGFSSTLNLASLDITDGFKITGIDAGDGSGYSVSSAGDVNGDNLDDILIGAPFVSSSGYNAGESYVVFGQSESFGSTLDLATLNGSNGFTLTGINVLDTSGSSVSSAGDVNGDGFDDILIGASGADFNSNQDAGESYLVFGRSSGFDPTLDLASLDGTDGFTLRGINDVDLSGISVSSAGDVNGDGFDDLLIGARGANPDGDSPWAGESYLVYGGNDIFDRFDFADGTRDGVIHLTGLGLSPADYDLLA